MTLSARERQAQHNHHPQTNFCAHCGAPVRVATPEGDARPRAMCTQCNAIHYKNPKIVVGCIPQWQEGNATKVLLCKRAIEPRYGFWTLPAGFMENGEPLDEGAAREASEEANAKLGIGALFAVIDVPAVNQVHMFYRATLLSLDFHAGEESLDVQLFAIDDIPWEEIAFPTVKTALKRFVETLAGAIHADAAPVHTKTLVYPPKPGI